MIITEKLLTPNRYSRPCVKREKTTKIAVHYIGNPNTTAMNNRNYFENLKNTHATYVSSNYIVGLDGEVIRCVPDDEIAYCTCEANAYSISIETCHPKSDGIFNDKTYISLCELCADLLNKYNLTVNDLIRHYDATGKTCPLHWSPTRYQSLEVANKRWNIFKMDVQTIMSGGKVTKNNTVSLIAETTHSTITQTVTPVTSSVTIAPTKTIEKIDVIYNVYSNKWWGEVVNWNDINSDGYAGVQNYTIQGLSARVTKGTLRYRVHTIGGGWYDWISACNINDWNNGVAGSKARNIDGIQFDFTGVSGYKVKYRCSVVGQDGYLPWVIGWNNTEDGYAGIYGKAIDCLQVEIVEA